MVEIAQKNNVDAILIDDLNDLDFNLLNIKKNIGISAGASAPEIQVQNLVKAIKKNKKIKITEIDGIKENTIFKLPVF